MFKNNLKLAWRNLLKHKSYSFINIFGLTLGVAAALFILQFVKHEQSYDLFHEKADRIYRLPISFYHQGELDYVDAMNYAPTGPALKDEMPEVEDFVRLSPVYDRVVMRRGNQYFEEEKIYFADSTLFNVFDFKLLEGDEKTCLTKPFSIVLTQSAAERYFGPQDSWRESPIGQTVKINNGRDWNISGIAADVPENSHLKFNALISFSTFFITRGDPSQSWGWNDFYTYVLLKEGTDEQTFADKLPAFLKSHSPDEDAGVYDQFLVQPLTDIHLKSNYSYEAEPNGDYKTVYFLSLIALAILFIAWVNYINLATARAEERAKEVGVRKVIGAGKKSLVFQFLTEAFIINSFAILMAVGVVQICQPIIPALVGKPLPSLFAEINWLIWLLPALLISGTVLSGLYPSFFLSAFSPVTILKGGTQRQNRGVWLRKGLVTFQYVVSILLIAGTFIVFKQLEYLQQVDLGFNLDKQLVLNAPSTIRKDSIFQERFKSFKNELLQFPEIKMVAGSSAIPGNNSTDLHTHGGLYLVGKDEKDAADYWILESDEDYVSSYQIKVIAGRNFAEAMGTDRDAILINQTAMRLLGINSPDQAIGKKLQYWDEQKNIVGVFKDYHHRSLRHRFEPMIIKNDVSGAKYYSVKFSSENKVDQLITKIEKTWNRIYPDNPFHHSFLDDRFNESYAADRQLGRIVGLFSILTILIACLGLFGLASYTVAVRTKEIGIRKVLGAPVGSIILMLTKGYFQLLVLAIVIGVPITFYVFSKWLENFAEAIALEYWIFILPSLLMLVIAFSAVGMQSLRAATGNPVEALRQE
ncbi:MAG: ABC transporter permease [Bacteroidota bacterium]